MLTETSRNWIGVRCLYNTYVLYCSGANWNPKTLQFINPPIYIKWHLTVVNLGGWLFAVLMSGHIISTLFDGDYDPLENIHRVLYYLISLLLCTVAILALSFNRILCSNQSHITYLYNQLFTTGLALRGKFLNCLVWDL